MLVIPWAAAHHSGAEYYGSQPVEITGTLVDFGWQNPHVRFTVKADPDETGNVVTWSIEAHSLSVLRRTNVTPQHLARGDRIKVFGEPSRSRPNHMFATNLLRADGVELVLGPGFQRHWTGSVAELTTSWFDPGTPSNRSAGLFRVWSTKLDGSSQLWRRTYPLTEAAKVKQGAWDNLRDTVARGCEPKGMPTIMEQPYPMEFVKRGKVIQLRMEEYDTVRTIHMAPQASVKSLARTRLGVSTGRWEGQTLVVRTDRIEWPWLDPSGVPLGNSAVLVERFTPSADGSRLDYSLTITSPEVFTEPVQLKRSWFWRPQERVRPYRCVAEKDAPR
jgi:hypothetical protein